MNVPNIAMSDHFPVCVTRSSKQAPNKNTHITIEYRDYKQFNDNDFLLELATVNFDNLLEYNDPNTVLDGIYNLINPMLNKHAKVKIKRVKRQSSPKWMNTKINEARHNRDFYHKKKDMENYRKWRNIVTELIRNAKVEYYRESITQNKCTSDIWKQLKEMTTTKTNNFTINHMTHKGATSQNQEEIANMYNDYITGISDILKNKESLPFNENVLSDYVNSKIPLLQSDFTLDYINDDQVLRLLSTLNVNKSSGTDNLGPRILKLCAPIIYKVVAYLINLSIKTSIFPDKLKEARITPIHKKGDKSEPCNYRPISILPTLSKIFEKHMASQIKNYVSEFNLLQKEQSGFREHHSCMTALTKMTETWLSEMDSGNLTGTVLLDFSKAFDLVNHNILLHKLKVYKFSEQTLALLKSYLLGRTQEVRIGKFDSEKRNILAGVPQGSVLGPLLFILFINDLPLHIEHSNIDIFADDATLHNSSKDIRNINSDLQIDVNNVLEWCKRNNMVLNENKTKGILIGTSQRLSRCQSTLEIAVNNHKIECSEYEKLLGINIDQCLSFVKHIDYVCQNLTSKISLLYKIKQYLPLETRKLYYNAYILPVMDYCLTVWGSASKSQLDRILKLQKRAARIILDMPPDAPSMPLFEKLGWLTVYERLEYNKAIVLYKSTHHLTPSYISDLFEFQSSHNYHVRSVSNNNMLIKRHNSKIFEKSLQYVGPRLWNSLPQVIRDSPSLQSFKTAISQFIISKRIT